jgi:photosystem II stability/assembly factor-like uncharacterized protein
MICCRIWLTVFKRSTYKAAAFLSELEPVPKGCVQPGRATRRMLCAAALLAWCVGIAPAAARPPAHLIDNFYATKFVDPNTGWAVGAFGTIFQTRDGGSTWHQQASHTVENLFGVDFAGPQQGWIVGRVGTVLHTSNGGETWEAQDSGTNQHLFDVCALDAQHAWAVGDWGTIISTADGGRSWQTHRLQRDIILNAEAWPDATHGWIVGEAGTILATSDGGATWTDQTSGVEKTLFDTTFTDVQHGWAVGLDGLILHTADGGQSWQVQHGNTEIGALDQVGFKEAYDNPSLYAIAVTDTYAYAAGDSASVFVSTDQGNTWRRTSVPAEANLRWIRALSLVNGTHGLLVGANGLTLRVVGAEIMSGEKEQHAAEMGH